MIDYYYEFHEGSKLLDQPTRYAMLRGFHPLDGDSRFKSLHQICYQNAVRVWLENANGLTLIREHDQDVHKKCDSRELTWIKLQAREL